MEGSEEAGKEGPSAVSYIVLYALLGTLGTWAHGAVTYTRCVRCTSRIARGWGYGEEKRKRGEEGGEKETSQRRPGA